MNEPQSPQLAAAVHTHKTLKSSMPTRWNSSLIMIQSLLDIGEKVVNGALQRCGHHECTITPLEKDMFVDLKSFLSQFNNLTKLVSDRAAMASLIPLIKNEIRSCCAMNQRDSRLVTNLKAKVRNNVERRLPETECVMMASLMDPDVKEVLDMTAPEKVPMNNYYSCDLV